MNRKRWVVTVTVASVLVSMFFTFVSSNLLYGAGYVVAFLVLSVFVLLGVVFDVIGVAVTSAIEAPFHSMAARKERGSIEALRLIKNADKVSSVCNDIVGDISGIVSGTVAALVAFRLSQAFSFSEVILQLLISGAVTGATIGGKAAGKHLAINNSSSIVLKIGKLVSLFSRTGKKC